jgi:hypothetical protein
MRCELQDIYAKASSNDGRSRDFHLRVDRDNINRRPRFRQVDWRTAQVPVSGKEAIALQSRFKDASPIGRLNTV